MEFFNNSNNEIIKMTMIGFFSNFKTDFLSQYEFLVKFKLC
ncbi:hypothetical protein LEP1GSC027_1593 [Leptospira interrogans str. 2002000624]|nr:hypothetical protein LEP1GSC027_1593 [Leptospira interrogans str. 2002000624]